MICYVARALLFLAMLSFGVGSEKVAGDTFKLPSKVTEIFLSEPSGYEPISDNTTEPKGKKWAVLVAGSNGYENYRHQADVCHAYQILKKGGLKDENIVVFMYDDIAFNRHNPRPGVIINKPDGVDVYNGVPKDYTGEDVNVGNLFAVILGNKSALTGGSGKVVNSGPNDHIFIYYSDHGGPGILVMPSGDYIYAKDLIDVLKKKHAAKTYTSMVFYLEACESGSIFEGLLPKRLNIYAVTAANANEDSYGTYCPDEYSNATSEYDTCLGDMFSISWMENCDIEDLRTETLEQQYKVVEKRTAIGVLNRSSHVTQYGNVGLSKHVLFTYMGVNSKNDFNTSTKHNSLPSISNAISQRDADLLHFWHKFRNAPSGSHKKFEAQRQLHNEISHRMHIDHSMRLIEKLLFGSENGSVMLNTVRPKGQPIVDDWNCFKTLVKTYEKHCGSLSNYGMIYVRAIANMCNVGVNVEQMVVASTQACVKIPPGY